MIGSRKSGSKDLQGNRSTVGQPISDGQFDESDRANPNPCANINYQVDRAGSTRSDGIAQARSPFRVSNRKDRTTSVRHFV